MKEQIFGFGFDQWTKKQNIPVVVDTDAGSEIDDQFGLAYTLAMVGRGKFDLKGVLCAPFRIGLPMSPRECARFTWEEIHRVVDLAKESGLFPAERDVPVLRGALRYMWMNPDGSDAHKDFRYDHGPWDDRETFQPIPVESDAVRFLIDRANEASADEPLFVIGIGAATNLASALMLAPEIADKIVFLYLGGNMDASFCPEEYNAAQDAWAYQTVGQAPRRLRFPCTGVTDSLAIRIDELSARLRALHSPLCDYLAKINDERQELRRKSEKTPVITVLWDIAPCIYFTHPEYFTCEQNEVVRMDGRATLEELFRTFAESIQPPEE